MKRRKYLGVNLNAKQLAKNERGADNGIIPKRSNALNLIKSKIIKVLKKHRVKKAGIFGSYVRGAHKKNSDIDILVEPPKGMGLSFIGLHFELEKALSKKVDLLTYRSLHPLLKKRILREEIRIL